MDKDDRIISQIEIRKCRPEDLDFVHDISYENMCDYVERHWGSWREDKFWDGVRAENITIIEEGGEPIGFFDVAREGDALRLRNIQLKKSHRGKGIGGWMMGEILKFAQDGNMKRILLSVFSDNPALGFYMKFGFMESCHKGEIVEMEKIIIRF